MTYIFAYKRATFDRRKYRSCLCVLDQALTSMLGVNFPRKNMWHSKFLLSLLICAVLITKKTESSSAACEQKEKNIAALDFAKEAISKAKSLQPTCAIDDKNATSNTSECGVKERIAGHLDIAMTLIEEAKKNYSACEETRNVTKIVEILKNPADCSDILERGGNKSGVYTIWPKNRVMRGKSIKVYCDMDIHGGGWTIIQRRGNFSNKVDFYRNWKDYKVGFGSITGEFWIGNDNIFALTNQDNYEVCFDVWKVDRRYSYAKYSSFWIEDETADYTLHLGTYNGTAGDGIPTSDKIKFSTKDKRNDKYKEPCTSSKQGGWWYSDCGLSNPNGINQPGGKNDWKYMNWKPVTEYDSLLAIQIKIRKVK